MTRRAVLFDLDGVLLDSAQTVRNTLAAVATCATGRRITPADLPPGALRRPRVEVLGFLGVTDPDDACVRWWDGALAATPPAAMFPGVLTGLLSLRAEDVAIAAVTLQYRHRLPWVVPPALADLLDALITPQDAPPNRTATVCTPPSAGSVCGPSRRCSSGKAPATCGPPVPPGSSRWPPPGAGTRPPHSAQPEPTTSCPTPPASALPSCTTCPQSPRPDPPPRIQWKGAPYRAPFLHFSTEGFKACA